LHGNCVACPRHSIILAVVVTRSRLYIFSSTSFPMPIPTYPELPISRNFTVCKAVRLAVSEGAPEFCLTFLRNSIPSSTLTHPSFTVFSPLQADIMLTSLSDLRYFESLVALIDLRALFPLLLSFVFLFFFITC